MFLRKLETWGLLALLWTCCAGLLFSAPVKRAYTPEDVVKVKSVSAPALSPDGAQIAYVVGSSDYAANKKSTEIYIVPSDRSALPRRLTYSGKSNGSPQWSPDGKTLAFLSERETAKGAQIYLLPLDRPGEARSVTNFPGGISDFIFSPDGNSIIFAARVYPDSPCLDTVSVRDSLKEQSKMKAKVHERLLYRHWDIYSDSKATHLFRLNVSGDSLVDLIPGLEFDALNYWLGSAGREFAVSPDSKWVYFAGNQDPDQAVSYNSEVYRVPLAGGEIEKLTVNPAADNCPRPSPDSRFVAWRSTNRPYYESDQYDLVVMDLKSGSLQNLTAAFDRSVGLIFWSASSDTLYFQAEDQGDSDLFAVARKGGPVIRVLGAELGAGSGYHLDCQAPAGEGFFIFLHRPYAYLSEVARFDRGQGRLTLVTGHNDSLWSQVYVPEGEDVYYTGAGGDHVHGMLFKPVNFDPRKKYPMLVRIHGGPQQMFGRAFRHEYALFTGAGYVVFTCNPRGSTGYGQRFTDQIRGDWGGMVIEDIKKGVRHVLAQNPFIDPKGVAAWGGSYGGFVCNWLEGHNEDGLFAALVSHAGDAEQWSSYGSTEELWFPEWEMFGTPWDNPKLYDNLSPVRYAKKFKTPMLLTHGDLDWRVPVTGSEQMFTALQRLGVPSKFIRFPDEGHWILKPQNNVFWYKSIIEWVDKWCKRSQ
ncbi:MAG TPA: S9 family peptidase [archaeon]|nr:S9 family peptidase [archaeon]